MRHTLSILFLLVSLLSRAQFRDSAAREPDTIHFEMQKSPWIALGLSAVAPGAGQIYLGQWYKTPFILGGIGACLTAALIQNNRYQYTSDSVRSQIARGDELTASRYTRAREFYRDDRDKFYIYAALVYVANLLDAYIASHLYDFDVADPGPAPMLTMPSSSAEPWRLKMKLRF